MTTLPSRLLLRAFQNYQPPLGDQLIPLSAAPFLGRTIFYRAPGQILLVNTADTAREILKAPEQFTREGDVFFMDNLREHLGQTVLNSDGKNWKAKRSELAPPFMPRCLNGEIPRLASEANQFAKQLQSHKGEIDLGLEFKRFVFHSIIRTIFDYEGSDSQYTAIQKSIQLFLSSILTENIFRIAGSPAKFLYSLSTYLKPGASVTPASGLKDIYGFLDDILKAKWSGILDGSAQDLFSQMIRARIVEGKLSENDKIEVYNEMVVLIMAGHETTAESLSWLLYFILKNPELHKQLTQEALQANPVGFDFTDMPLLLKCINESLRLAPPIFSIVRHTSTTQTINGIQIPKDTNVIISTININRNPHVWGRDASQFRPERHKLPNGKIYLNPDLFNPFGHGNHTCLGMMLALMQIPIVARELLCHTSLALAGAPGLSPGMTLGLKNLMVRKK